MFQCIFEHLAMMLSILGELSRQLWNLKNDVSNAFRFKVHLPYC